MGSSQTRAFHDLTAGDAPLRPPASLNFLEELVVKERFLKEVLNHLIETLAFSFDRFQQASSPLGDGDRGGTAQGRRHNAQLDSIDLRPSVHISIRINCQSGVGADVSPLATASELNGVQARLRTALSSTGRKIDRARNPPRWQQMPGEANPPPV